MRNPYKSRDQRSELTPRQREILELMAQGASNRGIAAALCISLNTLNHHLAKLYPKIGCANRFEAILYAARLPPPPSAARDHLKVSKNGT